MAAKLALGALWLATFLAGSALAREVGAALPADLSLGAQLDGAPVSVSSLAGQPALLTFWATDCGDCMRELPTIDAIHRKFVGRVHVLGVSVDPSRRDLAKFLRKHADRVTFPVSHDAGRRVARALGVRETPTSVLLDAGGVVRWRRVGFDETWLQDLKQVLGPMVARSVPAAGAPKPAVAPAPAAGGGR